MLSTFQSLPPSVVRLGDQNLDRSDEGSEPVDYNIEKFIVHPNFNRRTKDNDIALIRLKTIVTFSTFIRPACLHQHAELNGTVVEVDSYRFID